MKKLLLSMMVCMLLVAGCTTQKTEAELRAEIKQEMENDDALREELKREIEEEAKAEKKNEVNKKENEAISNSDEKVHLMGQLIIAGGEFSYGIDLEEDFEIDNQTVNQVFIKNWETVTEYAPKDYLTYYIDSGTFIDEKYDNKIDIAVEIDRSESYYESDRHVAWVSINEVTDFDGIKSPTKGSGTFTDDYYIKVFNFLHYVEQGEVSKADIREMAMYQDNALLREAIDALLTRGYFIQMAEGDYYINEEEKTYSDGEVEHSNYDKPEMSKNLSPSDIEIGRQIAGMDVTKLDYEPGNRINLKLEGTVILEGEITGSFNVMNDKNEFIFSADSTLEKAIVYKFNSGYEGSIERIEGVCNINDFLDTQMKNYILSGNKLQVKATVTAYQVAAQDQTSGQPQVELGSLEVIANESLVGYVEGENGKMPVGIQNEMFETEINGAYMIDYTTCKTVVIPMYDTVNQTLTEEKKYHFGKEDTSTQLKFTVLGELQDVKLNYFQTSNAEVESIDLGTIENATVIIQAELPEEGSTVQVTGRFHEGEGFYHDLVFKLDKRDIAQYEVYQLR